MISKCDKYLDQIAEKASLERRKHFGNVVNLFTPLYISNYLRELLYCGYNCITRFIGLVCSHEIEKEMKAIAKTEA